ncbi:hypothetical protein WA026_015196 [Henosepilachna vigintioctopunctata]|uniref:Pre-rRNA-processing protein Ipi1 N-terminal domain-containing protein n=1 Tax=Henosepilachna vigintioctopunctata TaxID=420089 RepID=A0AAW1TTD6_9CUCU
MGKNHRHKKRLKSEKSKTQLKTATKFLPKGQNVTKTDFKIKPIILLSQLQSKTSEDGQRDLDLKDVLSRLKHYNENMKVRACEDMDYLIKNCKEKLLGGNIAVVAQTLPEFIQTKMPKARKSGLSVIDTFLASFPLEQISPYFHHFSVNLRCAMTHIDRNIQEDSILFLDKFLKHVPTLLAKHSAQILPDFLMLISKLKSDADFKRTITVNLKSKFTSVGWRTIVLSRLYVFLDAVVAEEKSSERKEDADMMDVTYDAESFPGKNLLKSWNALLHPTMYVMNVPAQRENSGNFMDKQFSILIPLLLETWLEVAPINSPSKDVTYISEETSLLLNCVIKVFHILWTYLCSQREEHINNSLMTEASKLIKQFVKNIPYCLINRPKREDKPNELLSQFMTNDVKCVKENLLICYLYLVLHSKNPSRAKQDEINNIVSFITSRLLRNYNGYGVDSHLMRILEHVLIEKAQMWSRNNVPVHHILENTITLYEKGDLNPQNKSSLLKLLAAVSFEPFTGNEYYELWMENVPKLLLNESVDEEVIDIMFDMSRKNKVSFNKGYLNELPLILGHLPHLQITKSSDPDKAKLKVIDMLFYAPPDSKPLHLLKTVLEESSPFWPRLQYMFNLRKEFQRD